MVTYGSSVQTETWATGSFTVYTPPDEPSQNSFSGNNEFANFDFSQTANNFNNELTSSTAPSSNIGNTYTNNSFNSIGATNGWAQTSVDVSIDPIYSHGGEDPSSPKRRKKVRSKDSYTGAASLLRKMV